MLWTSFLISLYHIHIYIYFSVSCDWRASIFWRLAFIAPGYFVSASGLMILKFRGMITMNFCRWKKPNIPTITAPTMTIGYSAGVGLIDHIHWCNRVDKTEYIVAVEHHIKHVLHINFNINHYLLFYMILTLLKIGILSWTYLLVPLFNFHYKYIEESVCFHYLHWKYHKNKMSVVGHIGMA